MSTGEDAVTALVAPVVAEAEPEPVVETAAATTPSVIPAEALDEKVSTPAEATSGNKKTTQAVVALMKATRRLPAGTRVTIDFSDGTQMQLPPVEETADDDEVDTGGDGGSGPPQKKRRVRHCLLCMEYGENIKATSCKGRGGKRKCEYFNEDGTAKTIGSMPEAQAILEPEAQVTLEPEAQVTLEPEAQAMALEPAAVAEVVVQPTVDNGVGEPAPMPMA